MLLLLLLFSAVKYYIVKNKRIRNGCWSSSLSVQNHGVKHGWHRDVLAQAWSHSHLNSVHVFTTKTVKNITIDELYMTIFSAEIDWK